MESLDVFPNEVYEAANSLNMPFNGGHARGQISIAGNLGSYLKLNIEVVRLSRKWQDHEWYLTEASSL
jgi:hypothetical protein